MAGRRSPSLPPGGLSDGPLPVAVLQEDLNRGHRTRLRERFEAGSEALADYELLELVLFRSIPRQDTKPLAKALLKRFGSFAEVLAAPKARLREIPGVGESVAHDLKLLESVSRRFARGAVLTRDALSSFNAVLEYCRTAMAFENREHFRVLFLDKRNKVIADEIQQSGTVDHTPVYPREIVRRALELSATAVILVHNHPSGDPTPSAADITMTREIIKVAKPLGVEVHDHIIVGRDGHTSFKSRRLI